MKRSTLNAVLTVLECSDRSGNFLSWSFLYNLSLFTLEKTVRQSVQPFQSYARLAVVTVRRNWHFPPMLDQHYIYPMQLEFTNSHQPLNDTTKLSIISLNLLTAKSRQISPKFFKNFRVIQKFWKLTKVAKIIFMGFWLTWHWVTKIYSYPQLDMFHHCTDFGDNLYGGSRDTAENV